MANRKHSPALFSLVIIFLVACHSPAPGPGVTEIGQGHIPDIASAPDGRQVIVYGSKDSIFSSVGNGSAFSTPRLVAVLPGLAAAAMRGPQVALTRSGMVILAATNAGNIYAFTKTGDHPWSAPVKVTDRDSVNLEELTDLAADGDSTYAVWLDLRTDHRNKIFGAGSADGGKTWTPNQLIYKSPDSTVCQCCKPSVDMKDGKVYVMFRNWLDGKRDFYLATSNNNGAAFNSPVKLGEGSWALNGCPMDGGSLTLDKKGQPQTIWRREKLLYTASAGAPEMAVGEGKNPSIASVDGNNILAWTKNDSIVIQKSNGQAVVLGKGANPRLTAVGDTKVSCTWENNGQIMSARLNVN